MTSAHIKTFFCSTHMFLNMPFPWRFTIQKRPPECILSLPSDKNSPFIFVVWKSIDSQATFLKSDLSSFLKPRTVKESGGLPIAAVSSPKILKFLQR